VNVTKLYSIWIVFISCWVLALVLPHFQAQPTISDLLVSGILVLFFFCTLGYILRCSPQLNPKWQIFLYFLPVVSYLAPLGLLLLGHTGPYYLWSKLGAGSMSLDGNVFPLGDLAQLTYAATCELPVQIGRNVCDPWFRVFNQNPDVVSFMQLFKISNLIMLGVVSFLLFMVAIFISSRNQVASHYPILLFLFSPAASLAFERGNEVITLTLIILGIHFFLREVPGLRYFGICLLVLASIFKLWPAILVLIIGIGFRSQLTRPQKLVFLVPIIYWVFHLTGAIKMLESTQRGSFSGNSFGFRLWFQSNWGFANSLFLTTACLLCAWFVIRHLDLMQFIKVSGLHLADSHLLTACLATYGCLWFFGDNFSYRLIVMLPVLFILLKPHFRSLEFSQTLVVLILVSSFSVRLPITQAVTSVLAVISFIISAHLFSRVLFSSSVN